MNKKLRQLADTEIKSRLKCMDEEENRLYETMRLNMFYLNTQRKALCKRCSHTQVKVKNEWKTTTCGIAGAPGMESESYYAVKSYICSVCKLTSAIPFGDLDSNDNPILKK